MNHICVLQVFFEYASSPAEQRSSEGPPALPTAAHERRRGLGALLLDVLRGRLDEGREHAGSRRAARGEALAHEGPGDEQVREGSSFKRYFPL